MSRHKQVIIDTMNHLYSRIVDPRASDKERRRIALKAVEQLEPEPSRFSMEGAKIAEVQTAVESGQISVQDALAHERANAGRSTLIAWLEGREG